MKIKFGLIIILALCLSVISTVSASPLSSTTVISVVEDVSVNVRLESFPANETFYVYMGFNGTDGINGFLVSKIATNSGGTFNAKFMIPDGLKGQDIIAIRFESKDSNAYWYDWFYNKTGVSTTGDGKKPSSGVTYNHLNPGVPQFKILEVVKGNYIKLQSKYLPDNERWAVWIKDGALANKDWIEVNGFESGEGGIQIFTVPIPGSLKYNEVLAVKVQSIETDYFWFPAPIKNKNYP